MCLSLKIKFSLSSLYFTGSEAGSTNIHPFSSSIYFHLYVFNVGFPDFIASSMRMTHIVAEMNCFIANSTFCHDRTSLKIIKSTFAHIDSQQIYSSRQGAFLQVFFAI